MTKDWSTLVGRSWSTVLSPFLDSNGFKKIKYELKSLSEKGFFLTPGPNKVFDAFKNCPFGELKVVFLSTNSYVDGGDGLAFSYSADKFGVKKEASLIYDAVESDLDDLYLDRDYDMRRLAKQGVLMLNCDLTGLKGSLQKHVDLWEPFITYLVAHLSRKTPCIFVLIGQAAQKHLKDIDIATSSVYCLEHPINAVRKIREWDHKNLFMKLDSDTTFIFNKKINWFI